MKYEVIGWTAFGDRQYDTFKEKNYEDYISARLAVIENIRKNGYAFCADQHQYGYFDLDPSTTYNPELLAGKKEGCAPVLNNGKMFRCFSQREWGALMAEAWNSPNGDGMAYMIWYMSGFCDADKPEALRKAIFPKNYVDTSRILSMDTDFDTTIPMRYSPYRSLSKENLISFIEDDIVKELNCEAKPNVVDMTLDEEPFWQIYDEIKTVEVRLCDEKRKKLKLGDAILFFLKDHAEHYIPAEVIALHHFASFKELFDTNLFSKTGFDGYNPEEATRKMYDYYDQTDEEKYGVLAIEIKVLN